MAAAVADKGLILVFDLDQTIVDSHNIHRLLAIEEAKPDGMSKAWEVLHSKINMNLVDKVLAPAVLMREAGNVDAILMLTNNADRGYVANICYVLSHILSSEGKFDFVRETNRGNRNFPKVPNLFDYVMVRQHPSREVSSNPPKSLEDIKFMLEPLDVRYTDDADLARRTFFFDDNVSHVLSVELADQGYADHFVVMRGPDSEGGVNLGFKAGKPDLTDYISIEVAFSNIRKGRVAVPPVDAAALAASKARIRASALAARTAAAARNPTPSAALQRYMIHTIGSETGVNDANARTYLERAGWNTALASELIIQNMRRGGRRKKTVMNRLRRIYGRKLTRRHK